MIWKHQNLSSVSGLGSGLLVGCRCDNSTPETEIYFQTVDMAEVVGHIYLVFEL